MQPKAMFTTLVGAGAATPGLDKKKKWQECVTAGEEDTALQFLISHPAVISKVRANAG